MRSFPIFILILSSLLHTHSQPSPCRFAPSFSQSDLFSNASLRQQYLENVMYWEGRFHQDGIGINLASGLTYDGHPLNYTTGEATGAPHLFSAPSKESIHINLLTHIIKGDTLAQLLISSDPITAVDKAVQLLTNKITSYENFASQYPGYGGFLPWFTVNDTGMAPTWDWEGRVPSLDNGQLLWALTALIDVLETYNYSGLASRYSNQLSLMTQYAATIFYDGSGNIRTVAIIANMTATPTPDNYASANPCGNPCYLDDPYEGELFVMYLTLFGGLPQADINQIWLNKVAKVESVDYVTPEGNITVQKGWWFSAHENWKYLGLPYTDVPINSRVFYNGERARTWNSYLKAYPGMFASVTGICSANAVNPPPYVSGLGIQSIAFEQVTETDIVTGYSTMNLWLVDRVTALIWYDNYLKGPAAQGPYGATESVAVNGTMISPLTTWDSKMTTVAAILGGMGDVNREVMKKKGVYQEFYERVDQLWSEAFAGGLRGEDLGFKLPEVKIPMEVPDFTECEMESEILVVE